MWFILAVSALPTAGYFLIRQQNVQAYIVQKITTKLSNFFGTKITLSAATFNVFSFTLHDFCVRTPQNDTILYTPELDLRINNFAISSKYFEFDKITLNNPYINFYIDSTKNINFSFIINKLTSRDTTSSTRSMVLFVHELDLKNADFSLRAFNKINRDTGINFTDLHLKRLNLSVTNCRVDRGLSLKIKELSAIDKSGFELKQCSGRLKIDKTHMTFNNMNIQTALSDIYVKQVLFEFNSFKDFKAGSLAKNVKVNGELKPSEIASDDLAWFIPGLRHYNLRAKVAGKIYGRINDLKGRDIDISYSNHTRLKANFDVSGLPNLSTSFLHIDIKNLYTTPAEIESVHLPKSRNGRIVLPNQFKQITFLTYRGKFTGFVNDFVAYGTVTSNLGSVESDLSLRPDSFRYLNFQGQIKSSRFDLGKFFNKTDLFGDISMNVMVNGRLIGNNEIDAKMDGLVNSFVVNNYNYKGIKINGAISNDTYDGSVSISDPNINCDFLGKVDLSGNIPVFNFQANVRNANLYKLNFDKKDSVSSVSFYATADFEGNNIDNLNGEIKLWNATLRKTNKEVQISNFLLFTKTVNDTNHIILRSDLADADIWGIYRFKMLANSFRKLVHHYLPSLSKTIPENRPDDNNFRFELDLKDTRQLTDFFIPGLYISKDSKFSGKYNSSKNNLDFTLSVPLLQHNTKKWYDIYFNGKSSNGNFSLISGCKNLRITKQMQLENFTVLSDFKHDSIDVRVRWNNFDTIVNKGDFRIAFALKPIPDKSKSIVQFVIKPSQMITNDSLWQINSGLIQIDSSDIHIDYLSVYDAFQSIKIHGDISKQADRSLTIDLQNLNLSNLDSLLAPKKVKLAGIVRGKAELFDLYHNPIFRASLDLDSLSLNNESLGKTAIQAVYNNSDKNIDIELHSQRGGIRTLDITGTYATINKTLNFNVELNKLKMNLFEPFVSTVFSEVNGMATGSITLTGKIQEPLLNGMVKVQKATFVVNYLKTRYNFTHNVEIKDNTFLLKNIEVYDNLDKGQNATEGKAIVNGQIEYKNLKDLRLDVAIDAQNLRCLNTTEQDNTNYFGQGYATGNVTIIGTARSINLDIHAKTNSNTLIYIPLGVKNELSESNFIRFVNKQPNNNNIQVNQYEIDKPAETKRVEGRTSVLRMNFDLEVTPEAEVQIVFDPKIGDIVKGTGSGNLNLTYESGNFNMYGIYTIEHGQYLFTAKNVINRKFEIEEGGTLTWNGNPLDATVNFEAIFPVTTSLYPVLGVGNEDYKRSIRVECVILLTDKLMNPTIKLDIRLPNANEETKNLFKSVIGTEEELNNEVIALLFAGYFIPTNITANNTTNGYGTAGAGAAGYNGIEFLSNQLSQKLSQISKDFDIGVNYRPADQITTDMVALALSTQLINDKVIVNGNVDVGGRPVTGNTNSSNIVGEGNIEYKVTPNGKLRIKAFNRSNESYIENLSPYTQGVGVSYKENFNTFGNLLKRYYQLIFTRKENKNKPVEEDQSKDEPENNDE